MIRRLVDVGVWGFVVWLLLKAIANPPDRRQEFEDRLYASFGRAYLKRVEYTLLSSRGSHPIPLTRRSS